MYQHRLRIKNKGKLFISQLKFYQKYFKQENKIDLRLKANFKTLLLKNK